MRPGRVALALASLVFTSVGIRSAAAQSDEPPVSKKAAILAAKSAVVVDPEAQEAFRKQLDSRVGQAATVPINIYSKWHKETLAFDPGQLAAPSQDRVNYFLRCHFTNSPTQMDPRLFPVLLQAAKRFKVNRVQVVSGFRDPKYNLTLRKKGRQVARTSEHTLGHAVDFRLPGIPIKSLHAWARGLRLGGVGFYQHSQFIHVDVGRVRYWNGT